MINERRYDLDLLRVTLVFLLIPIYCIDPIGL